MNGPRPYRAFSVSAPADGNALLATASLGAVWSSSGQDYSAAPAADRLGQLQPGILVTADGWWYGRPARCPAAALARAHDPVAETDPVVVCGSLFLVGDGGVLCR